jgi:hypothetical protein
MSTPDPEFSVFGTFFIPQTIEQGTENLLKLWFPTYLKRASDLTGIELSKLPAPENYTRRNSYDAEKGEQLPKIVVVSPGLMGAPRQLGNGQYNATWRLGVGVACASTTESDAKLLCDIYGAAVRLILIKHGGKELRAKVNWIDEQYVDLPIPDQLRKFRAGSIWFSVDIENVANKRGKPDVPDTDPYTYPTVETVDILVDNVDVRAP